MSVQTNNLVKHYGNKVACNGISLEVQKGEVFGLLGPNGAGKSTLVKMLLGLLFPTSGDATVLSRPLGNIEARKKIGYLPENFKYHDWMTGVDLLSFHASLCKIDKKTAKNRITEIIEIVNLKGHENYPVGTYSKGMQQRIGIGASLISDPDLIFFDEPTSALDPIGRKEVREIILNMKNNNKTVFLNSHLLSEVEMICDSIAVINKGEVIKRGTVSDLLESSYTLKIDALINDVIKAKLLEFDSNAKFNLEEIILTISSKDQIPMIAELIINNSGKLYELSTKKESLENIYIDLIQGGKT